MEIVYRAKDGREFENEGECEEYEYTLPIFKRGEWYTKKDFIHILSKLADVSEFIIEESDISFKSYAKRSKPYRNFTVRIERLKVKVS